MKKMLALIAISVALVGCNDKPKTYVCGSESFEVSSDYIKVVGGNNSGVVIDNVSGNQYKLFSPLGSVFYTVNDKNIDIQVGTYKRTIECEVK